MIFSNFNILKSVKSVDTQPVLIDAQCEHIPTLLEHFQTVWRNGESIGILVVEISISSHYDVVALHGINYIRKEIRLDGISSTRMRSLSNVFCDNVLAVE